MTFRQQRQVAAYPRDEDGFLCGTGCYVDDIRVAGAVHGCLLRSPHAHAHIRTIDTARAMRAPGVLAVLTGEDIAGASAATPAVMNALVDALAVYQGVYDLQMPARASDVWAVIHRGR